jgi:hypothetical protein
MAGIEFSLSNIAKLISLIGPLFLIFFMIMLSIFNYNLKGLFYFIGLIFIFIFNFLLKNFYVEKTDIKDVPFYCNLFELGAVSPYSFPEISSMILSFTLIYLFLPMVFNNQMNLFVIFTIVSMLIMDTRFKITSECSKLMHTIAGIGFGLIFGVLWYFFILVVLGKEFLYFNELGSNNVVCKRPSEQTFKCSVYKNGELISSNIA